MRVWFHSLACWYPVLPTPVIKETVISPLCSCTGHSKLTPVLIYSQQPWHPPYWLLQCSEWARWKWDFWVPLQSQNVGCKLLFPIEGREASGNPFLPVLIYACFWERLAFIKGNYSFCPFQCTCFQLCACV